MSTKYILATAALVAVGATSTEAAFGGTLHDTFVAHWQKRYPKWDPAEMPLSLYDPMFARRNADGTIRGCFEEEGDQVQQQMGPWHPKFGTGNPWLDFQESIKRFKGLEEDEDMDEAQKLRLKKIVKGIKKVNNIVNKAQQVGLLEEEEDQDADADAEQRAKWKFDASVSGGHGRRPQWSASIGATWDEDEEQQVFFDRLDRALDTVYLNTPKVPKDLSIFKRPIPNPKTPYVKSLFDDEGSESLKIEDVGRVQKAVKAIRKIQKLGQEAADLGLLSKKSEERLRHKFDKLVNKIESVDAALIRRYGSRRQVE